jgi:hypothetical protein
VADFLITGLPCRPGNAELQLGILRHRNGKNAELELGVPGTDASVSLIGDGQ